MVSVFAFSFSCNQMQQNDFKMIDKERFYSTTNAGFPSAQPAWFTRPVSKIPAPVRKHATPVAQAGGGGVVKFRHLNRALNIPSANYSVNMAMIWTTSLLAVRFWQFFRIYLLQLHPVHLRCVTNVATGLPPFASFAEQQHGFAVEGRSFACCGWLVSFFGTHHQWR